MTNKKAISGLVALMFTLSVFISLILFPIQNVAASPGPEEWCVGSGCNVWSENVSHDGTTEVQSTGNVELRQEVDDYVSYWRFDKGTGNIAYDENETSNNDGSFKGVGEPAWTSSSRYGDYALDFDGLNDYVDCGTGLDMIGNITIETCITPSSLTGEDMIGSNADYQDYGFDFYSNNGKLTYRTHQSGAKQNTISSQALSINSSSHVAVTRSGITAKIYINGTETGYDFQASHVNPTSSPLSFFIGRYAAAAAGYVDGIVDEVRIYNRVLNTSEINQTRDNEHYTLGNLTTNHTFGSGQQGSKVKVIGNFPTTNYTVDLYASADGSSWNQEQANITSGTNHSISAAYKAQNQYVRVKLNTSYAPETPEIYNLTIYSEGAAGATPNITSWSNNYTNDNSADFSCVWSSDINFNATANQTITTWHWHVNNSDQNHNFDNFSYYFNTTLMKQIVVNATNTNGTSNSIQWNVTSNIPPEIVEVITIT